MINKIKVKNYKSIYKEIELDFNKSQINYLNNYVTNNNLINPVVLYGDNSSGKSCFLEAFKTIHILMSVDISNVDNLNYFDYHRYLGKPGEEIIIELELNIRGREYLYRVTGFNFDEIGLEELYYQDVELLNCDGNIYKYSKLRELANSTDNKHIKSVYTYLSKIHYMSLEGIKNSNLNKNSIDMLMINQAKINELLELIITDYKPIKFMTEHLIDGSRFLKYKELNNNVELSYVTHMSNGMKKLINLLNFLIDVPNESTVIIDEVENMIHPVNLIKLIETFNSLFNIQLIVSTHNTTLMTNLRPDQIYLVRIHQHNSYIKRLNSIYPRIRNIHNIEKLYYNGVINEKFDQSIEGENE
jgi:AAA15 family ATPase/GTPase